VEREMVEVEIEFFFWFFLYLLFFRIRGRHAFIFLAPVPLTCPVPISRRRKQTQRRSQPWKDQRDPREDGAGRPVSNVAAASTSASASAKTKTKKKSAGLAAAASCSLRQSPWASLLPGSRRRRQRHAKGSRRGASDPREGAGGASCFGESNWDGRSERAIASEREPRKNEEGLI